jgi:O-antigen biosynthesis protein
VTQSKKQLRKASAPAAPAADRIRLSLCMIVRNEAGRLENCLRDVKPVVDEIIVVDTGSTDQTKAVATAEGARVHDFPWCDDFSAARNASLAQATGDYILWLDADDRLDAAELDKLRRLKSRLSPAKREAYYLVVADEAAGQGSTCFTQMRLIPNLPEARFEWRIHEQISRSLKQAGVSLAATDIVVRHVGNHDPSELRRKSERNLAIILDEMKLHPDEPVLQFHAARTLANLERWEEAVRHLEPVLAHAALRREQPQLFLEAGILAGRYYNALRRFDQAERVLRVCLEDAPRQTMARVQLSESLLNQGRCGEAVAELTATLEDPLAVGTIPVNRAAFRFQQLFLLGRAYQELGETARAKEFFGQSLGYAPQDYLSLQELALLSLYEQDFTAAVDYYERLLAAEHVSDGYYSNLGLAYRKLGQDAKAERAFLKALGLNPERLEAVTNLGYLYLDRKDDQRALNCFLQAARLDPHLTDIKLALSDICYRRRDLDTLIAQCASLLSELELPQGRTLESLADLAGLYAEIGDALEAQGRVDLALLAFRLALLIAPQAEVLKKMLALAEAGARQGFCRRLLEEIAVHCSQDVQTLNALRNALEQVAAPAVAETR